jgi:glycosyltransferase involved in cell wall biosynthesis
MHIQFLIMNAYAGGGTVRTTFTCAAELARRHQVEVVSVYVRTASPRLPLPAGVRVTTLSDETEARSASWWWLSWRCWARRLPSVLYPRADRRHSNFSLLTDILLLRYLRAQHDGVLVSTRPGLNLITARFARRSVATVGQEHVYLRHHQPRLRSKIARRYPRLDLVTTLTSSDAADYRRVLAGRTRLATVPNALPDLRGMVAVSDRTVVVAAGRLDWGKGFDRLIPAYAAIAADFPDWHLQIYGTGKARAVLTAMIEELGLLGSIHLMGYSRSLHRDMAHAAIYVSSSRFEGFGMVLLEAMGIGLPVISFDCPHGPRDLIEHGINGLLVPDGDIAGLAVALRSLMADEERRLTLGAAARETAKRYDAAVVAARWELLFGELIAAK